MDTTAKHRFARISPQKARLVADLVRGKKVEEAINLLQYVPKKSASFIQVVLRSAVANAEHNFALDPDSLWVKTICVDEGPRHARSLPRAKGRADRIQKRTSHITVVLCDQKRSR